MDMSQIAYTPENVERVVNEFYATSQVTNEFKPQLDQWLKQAQNSQEAWQFSWLLIDFSKSINCQFYGASCLYNKVSKYLNDVPSDQYDLLKNKLLEKLLLYASSLVDATRNPQIRLIQRKLNSTLAKLALYLIIDQWPNCISDIIQTIPNCIQANEIPDREELTERQNQLILIVLDILTLLPDEYRSLSNLTKLKRTQINSALKKNFTLISQYLLNLFNGFNSLDLNSLKETYSNMIELCVKCLTNWIEFGVQFNDIQVFMDYLFVYIYRERLFEKSAECLTSILNFEENTKYTNSIFKYTPKVLELRSLLVKFVQAKDNDGCVVLTKLILSFGENQLSSLFDGLLYGSNETKQILLQLIELIMGLSSMPGCFPVDEESSDLTFVFWYTLQDTLLGITNQSNQLVQVFRPFFLNLLEVFVNKLQLPDSYEDWTEEEKERLRCYRIDIGDTMVYMIPLVGDVMLEFIIKRLVMAVESADANTSNWKLQESLIYMLQSVVSELNESYHPECSGINDAYLISFVNILPKIKYVNKHILSTTLLAIGSLGSWLERNTSVLPNAVSLCLLGLKTDTVTQSASFALKDIINECDLSAFADQIITTCQESLKTGPNFPNYEVRLMSICGTCISDLLLVDYQRSLNWLQIIIDPYLLKLNELAMVKQLDKHIQTQTCHTLNLLSQLMSAMIQRQQTHQSESQEYGTQSADSSFASVLATTSHNPVNNAPSNDNNELIIVYSILSKLMPVYKVFINRNLANDLVIIDKIFESVSVVLSASITSSPSSDSFFANNQTVELILNELISIFFTLPEDSWRRFAYEVCRQILILWWKNDKYKPVLQSLFLFSNQNAMKLMNRDMSWFHEHTDVVEQYSTCLAKLLKSKYYDLFEKLDQDALISLMRFAQLGLQLPEQYTLRAVATFIEEFIKFTKFKNNFIEFMDHNAAGIINCVIIGISGGLPRHLVDILSGILYTLIKEYPQLTNTILSQILIKNDFQPFEYQKQQFQRQASGSAAATATATASSESQIIATTLSKEQKAGFIKSLLSEVSNKRKFKDIVTEFSLSCRGLANTQYAKDTTNKY